MKTEIRRETPKPEIPPVKEVVITLTREEAKILRKLMGAGYIGAAVTAHFPDSPAVSISEADAFAEQLYRALPVISA